MKRDCADKLWLPEWNEQYQKWTKKYVRNHGWRVDRLYQEQDLMQEAWLVFNKLVETYPRIVDPLQFFNYYKRALINKIHDMSCRKTRRKNSVEMPVSTDIYQVFAGRIGEVTNNGYLTALIGELPDELLTDETKLRELLYA
ncbi:MAG TPA: hypothetical protein VFR24_27790 [Candidatus Angelobacter sp.]|nr:hypothetical protein [Candidatus Angelobacter sp.]